MVITRYGSSSGRLLSSQRELLELKIYMKTASGSAAVCANALLRLLLQRRLHTVSGWC